MRLFYRCFCWFCGVCYRWISCDIARWNRRKICGIIRSWSGIHYVSRSTFENACKSILFNYFLSHASRSWTWYTSKSKTSPYTCLCHEFRSLLVRFYRCSDHCSHGILSIVCKTTMADRDHHLYDFLPRQYTICLSSECTSFLSLASNTREMFRVVSICLNYFKNIRLIFHW